MTSPKFVTAPPSREAGEPGRLGHGWFFIPNLGPFARPNPIPVSMSRFVAQFRAADGGSADRPRRLDLTVFGDIADHVHVLARDGDREQNSWTFERFAPSYTSRIGTDLTGADIRDARFAPYNHRLDLKLERLLGERRPFYVPTRVDELGGERISHRLLIPMSIDKTTISHCLLMSV
jgi:hypothetical protein